MPRVVDGGTISINHTLATSSANGLRDIADDLNRLNTEAQTILRNMGGSWEGSSANAFATANEQWRRELKLIEQEINNIAILIRRVSDDVRDAERRTKVAIISGAKGLATGVRR